MMATYDLNGTMFRVSYEWPKFKLKKNSGTKKREQVIAEVTDDIASVMTDEEISKSVNMELVYWYDRKTRSFDPTLLVNGVTEEAAEGSKALDVPVVKRYSLLID
jgi:hypothetical protein